MRSKFAGGDLPLGLFLIVVAAAAGAAASTLEIGTAARMGPGFIPMALAGLLMVLGVAIAVQGVVASQPAVRYPLRPIATILAGLAFMALFFEALGLVLCIFVLTFVASSAQGRLQVRQVLLLATVLSLFCLSLFVWALGLPIPAWPTIWR